MKDKYSTKKDTELSDTVKLPITETDFVSEFLTNFKPIKFLGKGAYGCVFEAESKLGFLEVRRAIKRIAISRSEEDMGYVLEPARKKQDRLSRHKGIVKYYDAWIEIPPPGWQERADDELLNELKLTRDIVQINYRDRFAFLYVSMELCKSNLSEWLAANQNRDLARMRFWFRQIVSAVEYMHEHGQIHRDLKPSNIAFAGEDHLKLCDLGSMGNRAFVGCHEVAKERTFDKGTALYMAPEQDVNWIRDFLIAGGMFPWNPPSRDDPERRVYKSDHCQNCEYYRNLDATISARLMDKIIKAIDSMDHPERYPDPSAEPPEEPDATLNSKFESDFRIEREIGHGSFGTVFEVKNKHDLCAYAVKKVPVKKGDKDAKLALKEVRALAIITHPGIVKYNYSWLEDEFDLSYLYIQMEICESNLADWLSNNRDRDLNRMKCWFHQIVSAVKYIHHIGKIHRDLKPLNILFANDDQLKVCDLGLITNKGTVKKVEEGAESTDEERTFGKGTAMYMAPEQMGCIPYYSYKVDIFALGLILAELCVPLSIDEKEQLFTKYRDFEEGAHSNVRPLEPETDTMVVWLTNANAKARPDCEKILEHPFFNGSKKEMPAQAKDLQSTLPCGFQYPERPKDFKNVDFQQLMKDLRRSPKLSEFLTKFDAAKIIGDGAYGYVFDAQNIRDETRYAIKRIPTASRNACKEMKQARSLASLSHDGVVRYNSCWIEPKPDLWQAMQITAHDTVFIYIQMELCVCDLRAWLKHNKLRDLELAKMWFRQLVSGVAYLHKEGRIHRDLKPSNIMLGEEGNLKIGDLAISTEPLMENVDDIHEMQLRTTIGTPLYMPKEQETLHTPYNSKVDIFSSGLIFVELCVLMSFELRTEVFDTIRRNETHELLTAHSGLSQFVAWLTHEDPSQRPTAEEILEHDFLLQ